jgi:hypothetical protein
MTFAATNVNQATLTESNWAQSEGFSFISESLQEIMYNIATEKDGVENQYHFLSGGTDTTPGTNGEDDLIWVFVFTPSLSEI